MFATEHLLYDHLQQQGKNVRWQTQLQSLTQDESGIQAVLESKTGDTQTVNARYLVGCDGAASPVRHLLNLGFEGSTSPKLFYVADVEMEFEGEAATLHMAFRQDSFLLMIPMEGKKHWRLIGNMPEYDEQADRQTTYDEIEAKARYVMQRPLDITHVRWFSSYKVHTRHAEKFSVGRCFLAGDASHIHTPAGGQGMNTGIQDAYNLAWKLALVFEGKAADSLLDSYNEERLANAIHLLKTTDQFFDVATGDKWYLQFFRDNVVPSLAGLINHVSLAREAIFPTLSQTGIHYQESSLSQHEGDHLFSVKAGDRMPYFLVDGVSLYDRLSAPNFHLLIFSDGKQGYESVQADLTDQYGDLIDLNIIPLYPRVADIFDIEQSFSVFLRPDNHIGFISTGYSMDTLTNYMDQFIKRS